jgi:hypothetical protein
VRSNLNLRFFNIRVLWVAVALPAGMLAQPPAQTPPPPSVQAPAQPASQTPEQPQQQPQQPPPIDTSLKKNPAVPDYPDPRTLTFGAFYWLALPVNKLDVIGGKTAAGYGTLDNLGKEHFAPAVEVSVPLTRTAVIRFEAFLAKGDGTQDAPATTAPFGTSYNKGDFLSTQYQITGFKLSYDDLLYPYKYPVAKFRLKSLWEVQYIAVQSTFDAPLKPVTTDSSGNIISNSVSGTKNVILPTFGIAAEYAISPHVLLRAEASGFGIPHHSYVYDGQAYVAWRRQKLEIRAGFKALGLKTSPNTDQYFRDLISGGYVGILYHWQ